VVCWLAALSQTVVQAQAPTITQQPQSVNVA